MFEEALDEDEYDLYSHWCDLRDNASEKDLKLVNHLLECLIDFKENYPRYEITSSFLRDLKDSNL